MPKNVVFFIHGIGQHQTNWSNAPDGPISALNIAMQRYPKCFPLGKKLADYLDVVEIRYDDIFDTVLDRWNELGKTIPENSGFGWSNAVKDLMTASGGDKEIFLRYGGDVLLYSGFELVARTVRLRVNSIIATKIYQAHLAAADGTGNTPKFSAIAHSLGTTVIQDALYQLATANWLADIDKSASEQPKMQLPYLTDSDRATYENVIIGAKENPDKPIPVGLNSLFLVSNTAPLLRRSGDYTTLPTPSGAYDCDYVYNINHEFDPVSRICGGSTMSNPRGNLTSWRSVTTHQIHEKNIHSFGHYLSNPAVHSRIFSKLIEPVFTDNHFNEAIALSKTQEWNGFGGSLAHLEQAAKQKLLGQLKSIASQQGKPEALVRDAIEALATGLGD
jgi:hypothetical protein